MSVRPEASDPLRLLEEQNAEGVPLRTLLESAAEDGPTAEQVERLVAQLDQTLLEGAPQASELREVLGEPGGSLAAQSGGIGGLAKGAIAAGVALAVGAAVVGLRAPAPSAPAPLSGKEQVASEELEAEDEAVSEPSAVLGSEDREPDAALPDPSQEAARARSAEPPPRAVSETAPAAKKVPSEIRLLSDAQSALARREGVAALALTVEHQRAYPRGIYREEMDRIAIEALLQVGRRAEATSRAERFLQRFPHSIHRQRIEALLDQPSEGRPRVPSGR